MNNKDLSKIPTKDLSKETWAKHMDFGAGKIRILSEEEIKEYKSRFSAEIKLPLLFPDFSEKSLLK